MIQANAWMRSGFIAACLLACHLLLGGMRAQAQTTAQTGSDDALFNRFTHPDDEAKPWVFWYWMYGAVSAEGITADLEAMQQVGVRGAYLMPIKSSDMAKQDFGGQANALSPEWWRLIGHSMREADRLGLQLGMHVCDGFALAGGPWISPAESMQKVVAADTIVAGGTTVSLTLPQPEAYQGYYEDLALLALPVKGEAITQTPRLTCGNLQPGAKDKDTVTISAEGAIKANAACWIQLEYDSPVTARNVEIVLKGNQYQAHRMRILASDDGQEYRLVKQLVPARQGWQNTDANSTHAIPPTTARYFRMEWTPVGSEPGSEDMDAAKWKPTLRIERIILHGEPRLHQWEGKAALVWRVAQETTAEELPTDDCIRPEDIIDLTANMVDGQLNATLPAGQWRLLRLGHTATGHDNATGGGARGLECDKFDATMVRKQFDNWFAQMFTQTEGDVARRVLRYFHVDSWECGSQNWSPNFFNEFQQRRGYDLRTYLPLYVGIPMVDAQTSERVLRDLRTTAAELVVDVFYKTLADCAREYDVQFSAECVAPTMVSDGMLHYQSVDLPMGEFWLNSPTHDKPNDMLDAMSGGHIYGKRIIQAEGFTEVRGVWNESPATVKTLLDRNYALGLNRLFFHVYAHNPWLDRSPGMTLDGIGFFFQRDNTWWSDGGRALAGYAARCQALLQYGMPVTDIAVFTGEEVPRRAILPERLVPFLPGLFGQERVESERVRLANEGQPIREMPVGVYHTANMADPEDWVNPLRGYAYDSFNRDALLRLAQARDGRMVVPGASYRVLVVPTERPMNPNNPMSPEVRDKIEALRQAGVVIPALPYTAEDFSAYGLERDVIVPANIAWTHRRSEEDNVDIYFIANQEDAARTITASLRIAGRQPEWWDPMTGQVRNAFAWQAKDGRTEVAMALEAGESAFLIFRTSTDATAYEPTVATEVEAIDVAEWTVSFAKTGRELTRAELFDWSKETDEQVAYYSGTATYRATFTPGRRLKKGERVRLRLGELHDVAAVRVNGVDCGVAWYSPYEVDITDAVKKKNNQLEIDVTNTWANAILGMDQGKEPYEGIWTNATYRRKEKDLIPAGLLGPVELVITRE